MKLLLILLFQFPLRADRLPETIEEEYQQDTPVFYIITDDSRESRLLKGNLQRDWVRYGRKDITDTLHSLRIEKFVFIDHDDRETHKKYRMPLEYVDFPRYRLGDVGQSVPYPRSTFSCNIWSIDVTSLLVDQYFFYEQKDRYAEIIHSYNFNYNQECRHLIFDYLSKEYLDIYIYANNFQVIDMDAFLEEHPHFWFPEYDPPPPPRIIYPWEQTK